MQADTSNQARHLVNDNGLGELISMTALAGGRNNRVAKLECSSGNYLLKKYYYSATDSRNRLDSEYRFVNYVWKLGNRCVPKPVARDDATHSAIYEFVDGSVVNSRAITETDIEKAGQFILAINNKRTPDKDSLPAASEAGFSVAEHLRITSRRVERLTDIEVESEDDRIARTKVSRILEPLWESICNRIHGFLAGHAYEGRTLALEERWLSPSDFGFHNAIERANGAICFVDFEFAGWDDAIKLVCDFANQPDNILPDSYAEKFRKMIIAAQADPESAAIRFRLLQPVFQIKWACIILNQFLPAGKTRNNFTHAEDISARKRDQLRKLDIMLERATNSIEAIPAP